MSNIINKTQYNDIKTLSSLLNPLRIKDLSEIGDGVMNDNVRNSYLLTSSEIKDGEDTSTVNRKVKIDNIINYIKSLSNDELDVLRNLFDTFIANLINNSNEYIEFKENYDNSNYNYSYTINPVISKIETSSKVPIDDNDGDIFTNYYSYSLTKGLVDDGLLKDYVSYSLGKIIGVPGSESETSEAIDSIQEFVTWFKDYKLTNKDAGDLSKLLKTIDDKIKISGSDLIESLYVKKIGNDNTIVTSVSQTDGKISATLTDKIDISQVDGLETAINDSQLTAGTNISITDKKINCDIGLDSANNKSFIISGKKYSLSFNDGQFKIDEVSDPYVSFTLTLNSPSSATLDGVEYGTVSTSISLSAKPNKNCTITNNTNWGSNNDTVTANTFITATVTWNHTSSFNASLTVKESSEYITDDAKSFGHTSQATKTIKVTGPIYYASWKLLSDEKITSLSNLNNFTKCGINTNGYDSQYIFNDTSWDSGKFLYILINTTNKSHFDFYIGQGTNISKNPGGVIEICTYYPYGTSSKKKYTLYRSQYEQTANCNISIS